MPDAPAPETAILLVCCPDRRGIVYDSKTVVFS
jgi:hypothetical protein